MNKIRVLRNVRMCFADDSVNLYARNDDENFIMDVGIYKEGVDGYIRKEGIDYFINNSEEFFTFMKEYLGDIHAE